MPRLGFSTLAHKFHEETHHQSITGAANHSAAVSTTTDHSTSRSNSSGPHDVSFSANSNDTRPLSSPLNIPVNSTHGNSNGNGTPDPHSSRRSFFGLSLGKTSSNESQYSITSDDNHHGHPHNYGSHGSQFNLSNHGNPPPIQRNGSSSMVQLKKFFRPTKKNSPSNNSDNHGLNHSHGHSSTLLHQSTSTGTARRPSNLGSSNANLKQFASPGLTSTNSGYFNKDHGSHSHFDSRSHTPSTPTFTHDAHNNMIVKTDQKFWDDLEGSVTKKYGKLGKVLGSGAGGSVRLIVRESDGVTFAVKEFVPRRPNESVKEYAKKCTAEFCIGSTLHHPNIIQTLDIINENNHFFEVMEYAPIDFFAVVMSGQMTRSEINCCFKQITLGVAYLHTVGLSHRDLKLDNCVVTKDGIVKLIDFGSAVVFKYPFENDIVLAHGIVGSDPYLAPEVLTSTDNYDPQFVDIWSIAIIYCCMTLRRFPWKAPKMDDPSFSLYCMPDDQPRDYVESAHKHKELLIERKKKIMQLQQQKERASAGATPEPAEASTTTSLAPAPAPAPAPATTEEITAKVQELKIDEKKENEKETTPTSAAPVDRDQLLDEKLLGDPNKMAVAPQIEETAAPSSAKESTPEQHKHHHQHQDTPAQPTAAPAPATSKQSNGQKEEPERRTATTKSQKQIHGPYRLMRLLPHAARPIISKMLTVDFRERATIKEIVADEWFTDIKYCTMDEDGNTINDPGHHHTIV